MVFLDGREVEVVVHVVQENRKKSFLGGYKHRLTGWSSKLRLLKYSFVLFFFKSGVMKKWPL